MTMNAVFDSPRNARQLEGIPATEATGNLLCLTRVHKCRLCVLTTTRQRTYGNTILAWSRRPISLERGGVLGTFAPSCL
jgi:hypothetical protein